MMLVETEGSYTKQITLDSLDVHVGRSFSVLVTANQNDADYYIVATPTQVDTTAFPNLVCQGVLHHANSNTPVAGTLPSSPNRKDQGFSIEQAKSIRWNLTTGAARPNPQGTYSITNKTLIAILCSPCFKGRDRWLAIGRISHRRLR
ncbi:hypothetical protein Scep_005230 [Stephania cephalantha]|uniref:Plastocyanin-like domain-containing protein n=1 Tax=Stephania cephalantha TaxID=152367 RepID=A0AAP0KU55_9MAGN